MSTDQILDDLIHAQQALDHAEREAAVVAETVPDPYKPVAYKVVKLNGTPVNWHGIIAPIRIDN